MVKTMVKQIVPLQTMKDPRLEQVDALKGGCDPLDSPMEQVSGRICGSVGDPHWSSLFLKDPWKGPMLKQIMKNCSPWEKPMLEKFTEGCLVGGTSRWIGEECEEEGAAETKHC
ncbi:hypothetical protein BTVI_03812 [Pitangus sulphuratus]|nr:hypothetical protein BTVI_03812 [Pitangus sulphuratus]